MIHTNIALTWVRSYYLYAPNANTRGSQNAQDGSLIFPRDRRNELDNRVVISGGNAGIGRSRNPRLARFTVHG